MMTFASDLPIPDRRPAIAAASGPVSLRRGQLLRMPLHRISPETKLILIAKTGNICSTIIFAFKSKSRRFFTESPAQRLGRRKERGPVKLYELLGADVSLPMSGIREP